MKLLCNYLLLVFLFWFVVPYGYTEFKLFDEQSVSIKVIVDIGDLGENDITDDTLLERGLTLYKTVYYDEVTDEYDYVYSWYFLINYHDVNWAFLLTDTKNTRSIINGFESFFEFYENYTSTGDLAIFTLTELFDMSVYLRMSSSVLQREGIKELYATFPSIIFAYTPNSLFENGGDGSSSSLTMYFKDSAVLLKRPLSIRFSYQGVRLLYCFLEPIKCANI